METRTENRGTPPRAAAQSRAAAPAGLRGQSRGEGGRRRHVMSDPARFLKYMAKAAREVSVRECVCAGVSVCTCAHVRVRVAQVSARTCARVRVCMCAHVSVCACTCAHVSVRVCVDTRVWGRQAGCRQSLLQEVAKWHLGFFYFL